jgi:hypothetical protein
MKLAAKDNKLIKASKHETRVGLCDQCAALLIAPYFPRFETLVSRILSGTVK